MSAGSKPFWTDAELGLLADTMDLPAAQAAEIIGRSIDAVKGQRRKVARGWAPTNTPWSQDEIDYLRSAPNLTAAQIAERLGRTAATVAARRALLGLNDKRGQRPDPTSVGRRTLLAKTCLGCGFLLDASWFGRKVDRAWRVRCLRCQPAAKPETSKAAAQRKAAKEERLQQLSLSTATRRGEPWLERDDVVLADPELSTFEKAVRTGRTYFGTAGAIGRRGHSIAAHRGDPEDAQWRIELSEDARALVDA